MWLALDAVRGVCVSIGNLIGEIPLLTEYEVSPKLWDDYQRAAAWLREHYPDKVTGLWSLLSSEDGKNGRRAIIRYAHELPTADRLDIHGNIPLNLIDLWDIIGNDTRDIDAMCGEIFQSAQLRCVLDSGRS